MSALPTLRLQPCLIALSFGHVSPLHSVKADAGLTFPLTAAHLETSERLGEAAQRGASGTPRPHCCTKQKPSHECVKTTHYIPTNGLAIIRSQRRGRSSFEISTMLRRQGQWGLFVLVKCELSATALCVYLIMWLK